MWGVASKMITSDNEGDTVFVTNANVDKWKKCRQKEISFTEITRIEARQNKKAFTILSSTLSFQTIKMAFIIINIYYSQCFLTTASSLQL